MTNNRKITREKIINALVDALEPLEYVYALWEGGAAAFNRVDEWSDIDVQVDVDDNHVDDVFQAAEQALKSISKIDKIYEVPEPTWHGHSQKFYHLEHTSEFLVVDLAVMKHSSQGKFLEPEMHGNAVFHFNKDNVVKCTPLNKDVFFKKLQKRYEEIQKVFDMFQSLTTKEINRGSFLDALGFYRAYTLNLLVEALRIKYSPFHYEYKTRYIHYDLPEEVVERLRDLFIILDEEDLRGKHRIAGSWFWETIKEIDIQKIGREIGAEGRPL